MWAAFARFILQNRLPLILIIGLITILLGIQIFSIEIDYKLPRIIPKDDPVVQQFNKFQEQFGDDGNSLVIGFKSKQLFEKDLLNKWYQLGKDIEDIYGVTGVLSVPNAIHLKKNSDQKRFELEPLQSNEAANDEEADSLKNTFSDMQFYKNRIYNEETGATFMAVSIKAEILDSKARSSKVTEVTKLADAFAVAEDVELHYSGLPVLRSLRVTTIADEMKLFMLLAICVMATILLILFRSISGVVLPLIIVTIGVIWTLGSIVLFGLKLSLLTGLVPTLVIIIGIPNCIYLLNKYHLEYLKSENKGRSLFKSIERIGNVTFFANLTTAIGFGVFAITKSEMLREFGIIAGLNVLAVFFISIIVLPSILSYLPPPKRGATNHLENKLFNKIIGLFKKAVLSRPTLIFIATGLILLSTAFGIINLKSQGYIFDDIPKHSKEYIDLKFFEDNFTGVVPLDIVVDTRKKGGATSLKTLNDLDKAQKIIAGYEYFSEPISVVNGLKMATQAYYSGKASRYGVPNSMEKNFILSYLGKMERGEGSNLLTAFTDDKRQLARISFQMKDIGSNEFPKQLALLKTDLEEVLPENRYDVQFTGTGLLSLTGYNYLVNGLVNSVLFAFILIAIIMSFLFKSIRMLMLALIPNFIPLLITAAIMGMSGVYLKPSTVIIFSVAFGISVDFTIHFLAKFRLELDRHDWDVKKTVFLAMDETGYSMIYTAIILLCGFSVFLISTFEGTIYLGLLTCTTLIVSLFTNLLVLPSLLLKIKPSREIQKRRALVKAMEEADEAASSSLQGQ